MSLIPVFDIGDTLVPSRKFASHIIEDELRQRNHRPVHSFDPDKFMMYDPDQIREFLAKYDIEGDEEKLAKDCRERYIEAFEDLMLENDVFDFFAKCNQKFGTIGVISDNTLEAKNLLKELLDKHEVEYDTVIVSDEVGVEKPNQEIFEAFLNEREEEASQFVYIGNDAKRDSGALEAGMNFIWTTQFDNVNSNYDGSTIDELKLNKLEEKIKEVETQ